MAVSPGRVVRVTVAATTVPPPAGRRKTPVLSKVEKSNSSLKRTSTGALISALSAVLEGTVETTVGKASSSTRSPVSKTWPLLVREPADRARPSVASRVAFRVKLPTVTGENEKRPSGPLRARIEPSALLAELNLTKTCAPAAGVSRSGRISRPATVPLAVRIRFFVTAAPGTVRLTWVCAPWAREKAANCIVPMGMFTKRNLPSLSATIVSFFSGEGTSTGDPEIRTVDGIVASTCAPGTGVLPSPSRTWPSTTPTPRNVRVSCSAAP